MEYVNELDTISAGAAKKEAALKVHRLTFMEATMMVVGSTIGSGVLGLAFASRNAGWPVLLTWLVVAGFFSIISMLYVAEATLRTGFTVPVYERATMRISTGLVGNAIGVFALLQFIVTRTKIGMAMRAASRDFETAQLMGIKINAVISMTFVIGSFLAAVGAMLYFTNYPSVSITSGGMPGPLSVTA